MSPLPSPFAMSQSFCVWVGEYLKPILIPSGDQTGPPVSPLVGANASDASKSRTGADPPSVALHILKWSRSAEFVAYASRVPSGDQSAFGDPRTCSMRTLSASRRSFDPSAFMTNSVSRHEAAAVATTAMRVPSGDDSGPSLAQFEVGSRGVATPRWT